MRSFLEKGEIFWKKSSFQPPKAAADGAVNDGRQGGAVNDGRQGGSTSKSEKIQMSFEFEE